MLGRTLRAEWVKLGRSSTLLAILLLMTLALIPSIRSLLVDAPWTRPGGLVDWRLRLDHRWTALAFPFLIAIVVHVVWEIDRSARTWAYLGTLPVARSAFFDSKLILSTTLLLGAHVAIFALSEGVCGLLAPRGVQGQEAQIVHTLRCYMAFGPLLFLPLIALLNGIASRGGTIWLNLGIVLAALFLGIAFPQASRWMPWPPYLSEEGRLVGATPLGEGFTGLGSLVLATLLAWLARRRFTPQRMARSLQGGAP
jgi:hypothetical protein